jgi:translation initiation factor 5A
MSSVNNNSGDAGASQTVPIQAGLCKKGTYVLLKGNPCKVLELSTSKTGKHGHAKANITGVDIFTGKKYQDISPTTHNLLQPIISKTDYTLIEIDEDNFITVMNEEGEIREDLSIEPGSNEIHKKIQEDFNSGKNISITVLKSMGKEKVISYKEIA